MKRRIFIIVILFCMCVCFSTITYSLFTSEAHYSFGNMEIAEFIFETKRTNHIELDFMDLKPGDTNDYKFEVTNTKNNIITNVTTQYRITVKTFHLMPLLIELYKGDELVMTCDKKYSRNKDNALVCNSDVWELNHKISETEKFNLKVSFPKEYNSSEYTELVDYIDVDISSWQKINRTVGE